MRCHIESECVGGREGNGRGKILALGVDNGSPEGQIVARLPGGGHAQEEYYHTRTLQQLKTSSVVSGLVGRV